MNLWTHKTLSNIVDVMELSAAFTMTAWLNGLRFKEILMQNVRFEELLSTRFIQQQKYSHANTRIRTILVILALAAAR